MKSALIAAVVAAVVAAASGTAATIVVTSKQIKNGTIQTVDISPGAKRALKGNRGPRGYEGVPGADGAVGPTGPQSIQSLTIVSNTVSVLPGQFGQLTATCPSGQRPVSGGFSFLGITLASHAVGPGWFVIGENDLINTQDLKAYAYCSPNITVSIPATTAANVARVLDARRAGSHRSP